MLNDSLIPIMEEFEACAVEASGDRWVSLRHIERVLKSRQHTAAPDVVNHMFDTATTNMCSSEISVLDGTDWHIVTEGDKKYVKVELGVMVDYRNRMEANKPVSGEDGLKKAIDGCIDDTWECPSCGHSESWWKGSNAHYESKYPYDPMEKKNVD